jgi:hypothetical protein
MPFNPYESVLALTRASEAEKLLRCNLRTVEL